MVNMEKHGKTWRPTRNRGILRSLLSSGNCSSVLPKLPVTVLGRFALTHSLIKCGQRLTLLNLPLLLLHVKKYRGKLIVSD